MGRSTRGLGSSYVADFETTTNVDDCRVWGWAVIQVGNYDNCVLGNAISEFFNHISHNRLPVVYFHNLKFDGRFILSELFDQGYVHSEGDNLSKGQFSTLISRLGQFYSVQVCWKSGGRTEFRDSLKKVPMRVSEMSEAYGIPDLKGDIDYEMDRPSGWVMTDEERSYIINDVTIPAKALEYHLNEGMTRLTVGSDSLAEFKRISGKRFDTLFPVLDRQTDSDIRRSYRGGYTYLSPRYAGKILGAGEVFDVNSLYPYVMRTMPLPYMRPRWFDHDPPEDELYVTTITFTAHIRSGFLPCIQLKGSTIFNPVDYQTDIDDPITLTVTSVDLDLWNEHYDIDILEYHGGWSFRSTTGMFDEYIDKWMHIKNTSDGALKALAKLHLNSLYGKFATNPDVTGKIPYLDDNGVVRLKTGSPKERDPVYTPVGVFVTAYARSVTIRAAQSMGDRFIYADTDSLHLIGEGIPSGIDVDSKRLGAWKHELSFTAAAFTRAKCYSEQHPDGYVETHIAGLPRELAESVTLYDHVTGVEIPGKLVPTPVKGGVVLTSTTFTLVS